MTDFTDIKKGDKVVIEYDNAFTGYRTITREVTKVTKKWIVVNTKYYSRENGLARYCPPFSINQIKHKE